MRTLLLLAVVLGAASTSAQPNLTRSGGDLSADLAVGESTTRALLLGNDGTAPLGYSFRVEGPASAALYAAEGNRGRIYGIDPATGATLSTIVVPVPGPVVFDGGTLYTLADRTLQRIDPVTGSTTTVATLRPPAHSYYYVQEIAWLDGLLVASAQTDQGSAIDLYTAATGAFVRRVTGPTSTFQVGSVAAGEGVIFAAGYDQQAGRVLVSFDAATGAVTRTLAFPDVRSLSYSRALDELHALSSDDLGTVRRYRADTGAFIASITLPTGGAYAYYSSVASDEGREVPWLSIAPRSGTIAPNGQIGVTVGLDARRVVAGTYEADVVLRSNDPDEPVVRLPAQLVATGAPAIAVVPSPLDFGVAYVGTPVVRRVEIVNPGSDTLRVSALAVSDARLAVANQPLVVLPADTARVDVTFTPTGAGALEASLTLDTNVEGSDVVVIAATGDDRRPSVLSITADSVIVQGTAGEAATATLSITNEGDGPLLYRAFAGLTGTVVPVRADAASAVRRVPESPRALAAAAPQRLDGRHRGTSTGVAAPPLALLMEDPADTDGLDLLAVRGAIDGDSLYVAFDFAQFPRSVSVEMLLDLDTDPNTGAQYYGFLGAEGMLAASLWYDDYAEQYYGTVSLYAFDDYASSYSGHTYQIDGRSLIVSVPLSSMPARGNAFDAFVVTSGYVEAFGRYGVDQAPNEGVLALSSPTWLGAPAAAGRIEAGASGEVALALDASALLGGVYHAAVLIEAEGPVTQRARVPVAFDVTGIPAGQAAPLAFGQVFVGHASVLPLEVTNTGTDDLVVTAVTSSIGGVAAEMSGDVRIRPGATRSIPVAVTAADAGAVAATLTLVSNAPGTAITAAVTATAIRPPVLAVSASTVSTSVRAGETAQVPVTLTNGGASELQYRARVVSPAVGGVEAPALDPSVAAAVRAESVRRDQARVAGSLRTGQIASSSPAPLSTTLPTLLIDPDEGLDVDLVEIRADRLASGEVAVELVLARSSHASTISGVLFLDTDQSASTGYQPYVYGEVVGMGADLEIHLGSIHNGEVYVYVYNGASRYLPATLRSRTLRFTLPASLEGDGVFNLAGYLIGQQGADLVPDQGVASMDARLGWLRVTSESGTVAAGASTEMRLDIDATALPVGDHTARLMISTNDPASPVLTIPVDVTVEVGVAADDVRPDGFALAPPAPNPTRGSTRLAYALPEGASVRIEVFDALGRQVASLDEGARPAGRHVAELDAGAWTPGVYSVRVHAGRETAIRRLSVVR